MKMLFALSFLLLCLTTQTALAGQWGTMVWGVDKWGDTDVIDPPPNDDENPLPDMAFEPGYPFDAKIAFHSTKDSYSVGEFFAVDLLENVNTLPSEGVDLWIAVETPDGHLLFMTPHPFTPFSSTPQAFMRNVTNSQMAYQVLGFEVPPGMAGTYTFYAVYMEQGKDPSTDGFIFQRSNLAFKEVTLEN